MWRGRGPARGQLPQRPQGRHVRLPGWCGGVEVEVVCVCVWGGDLLPPWVRSQCRVRKHSESITGRWAAG